MDRVRELQDKIIKLKKEKGITILAHSYQSKEILEVADFTGDSYKLSVSATKAPHDTILMCGVHFMAETVKLLSPHKKVILANPEAGCNMANQIEPEFVEYFKKHNPGYTVVCYINTTAATKTVCDVCVTSSSAVKIVEKIDNDNILFLPDRNLGAYVQSKVKSKNIHLFQGCCPIHAVVDVNDVKKARELHKDALLLVHPECDPKVVEMADYVGSTSGIMEYARKSDAKEFIIGTELNIAEVLSYELPEKNFYLLSQKLICPNMRITSLMDVYKAMTGEGGLVIEMDEDTIKKARKCIDEMIRLGG